MKTPLFFFLFGILFYEIIFPILSGLSEVIQGALQLLLGKQAVKMAKYNEEIAKYKGEQEEKEPEHTFCMGFQVPSYSDDEEEEDDE